MIPSPRTSLWRVRLDEQGLGLLLKHILIFLGTSKGGDLRMTVTSRKKPGWEEF